MNKDLLVFKSVQAVVKQGEEYKEIPIVINMDYVTTIVPVKEGEEDFLCIYILGKEKIFVRPTEEILNLLTQILS